MQGQGQGCIKNHTSNSLHLCIQNQSRISIKGLQICTDPSSREIGLRHQIYVILKSYLYPNKPDYYKRSGTLKAILDIAEVRWIKCYGHLNVEILIILSIF